MLTPQKQLLTHLLHSNNNKNKKTFEQLTQVETKRCFWFRQPENHCWRLWAHLLINSEKVKEVSIYESLSHLDPSSLFDN